MNLPTLTDTAHFLKSINFPPRFRVDESRLLVRVLRDVAEGLPVSRSRVEQTAANLQMSLDAATSFLNTVSEYDDAGNVVGILGLSQKNHPHRFKVNGQLLSTWCAWDALFLPALLGQGAEVESSCPLTNAGIRLRISPDDVEEVEPPASVLTIALPSATGTGLESFETIWKTFCCLVHFFVSEDAALQWISAKDQNVTILSVKDGHRLGGIVFEELLESV